MPKDGTYPAPLSNYYGRVILSIKEGVAELELEDYAGLDRVIVTAEFAEAWAKQFPQEASS